MARPKGYTMPTTTNTVSAPDEVDTSNAFVQAIAAAVAADMKSANLTVTELSERSGLSRRKLARRLAGAPLKTSELAALGLVLGRRPSDWFRIVEQQGADRVDTG